MLDGRGKARDSGGLKEEVLKSSKRIIHWYLLGSWVVGKTAMPFGIGAQGV